MPVYGLAKIGNVPKVAKKKKKKLGVNVPPEAFFAL
jgi:hypothetical protein